MKEFIVGAKRSEAKDVELFEFSLGDGKQFDFEMVPPTAGQSTILFSAAGIAALSRAIHGILKNNLVGDGYARIVPMIEDGRVSLGLLFGGDENNRRGIIDTAMAQASGRPTKPSSGSTGSPKGGGKRSTGRSPGKGSTLSSSPSTAS